MNQELRDSVEAILVELEQIHSGSLYYGSHSANPVAVGFGSLQQRDMVDGGYNKKYEFSILPRVSDIGTWGLKDGEVVGFVGNALSGSFIVKGMENVNEVYSLLRLIQKT